MLSGSNTYGGATAVRAGTLTAGGPNVLPDGSAVSVAAGATLALNGNDSVASLTLAGLLTGTGTLSAANYALAGGNASASLGAGTLTSTGSSTIAATAGALGIAVNGGTLTLAGPDQLADAAAVTVAGGAALNLNGSERVGTLALAGLLSGSGTLTAASYALDGASVVANIGAGALTSTGSSQITGGAAVGSVLVSGGTLTLASAGRLSAAPSTTVASGATLALGGATTLGTLSGAGGVNLGSATLTTGGGGDSSFGGVIAGSGALVKTGSGSFTLGGSNSYTGGTSVQAGTLAAAAAAVLPDDSAVTVSAGAALVLNGNDTVASLQLSGLLSGSGTLTAATYSLGGGTASANLGAGALTSSGSSLISGTSAAGTVAVASGTLSLGSAQRLDDAAAVSIASGAALTLAGNETVGTLAVSGSVAGSGVLSAASYTLLGGSVGIDLGTGSLVSSGSSRLDGRSAAGTVQVSDGTLTLGAASRLSAAPAVGVVNGATLALGGAETFGSLSGPGTVALGAFTLHTGGGGDSSFAGVLSGAAGSGLVKQGNSAFTLAGANTYAGSTRVEGGTLNLSGTLASTTLQVSAGTLALGAAHRLPDGAAVSVASGASMTLVGDETVSSLALSGALSGSGTLTAASVALDGGTVTAGLGAGALTSTGSSTLSGSAAVSTLVVSGGTLVLSAPERLTALPAVTVAAPATLRLAGDQRFGLLAGAGAVDLGAFTLASGAGGDSSFSGVISGSGGLTKQGSSVFTLAGANGYTGATRVDAGTLQLAAADRLADASAVSVASGATLALSGSDTVGSLALAGTLSGSGTLSAATYSLASGTVNADLGSGVLSSTGTSVLAARAAAGTLAVDGGSLQLASAGRLSAQPALTVASGATLQMGGDETFGTLAGAGNVVLNGFTLRSGVLGDSTFSGVLAGGGSLVKQGSGHFTLTGDNGFIASTVVDAGTLTIAGTMNTGSVAVNAGTLALAAADRLIDLADVTVAGGATLSLAGDDTVRSLVLAGSLVGSGTLTAATYHLNGGSAAANLGAGSLISNGASRIDGTLLAGSVGVNSGTLTLGSGQRLLGLPDLIVSAGAALILGGPQTAGRLSGNGSISLGAATLSTGAGGDSSFGGVIDGSGGLNKQGPSSFTLGGANTYTGVTRVEAGTLLLAAADRLADATPVSVLAGATLVLAGNDTVGSLALAGSLNGGGTLSAATYSLDGGTVNADLGSGVLSSVGASVLNGSAAAGTVAVDGGSLLLASAGRLSAAPALTVAPNATLQFGGDQRLGLLAGAGHVALNGFTLQTGSGGDSTFSGVLSGTGSLVKQGSSAFTLAGDNTYGGSTRIQGGTLNVAGTLASSALQVDAGTLALAGADRLLDSASVGVAGGGVMLLSGNDTVANLALSGLLSGNGTLTAATYALDGGTAAADLGTGALTSIGSSLLSGTSAAGTVAVNAGTLALGSAQRLADAAAVTVAGGATLNLAGDDSVASLALRGTLGGSGTLSAATYALEGGTANANLGSGALTSSGSSLLAGTSAANTVAVNDGLLTLASAQRLVALPAVSIAPAAALAMTGDQAFGNLGGAGLMDLGSFRLTTGTGGDSTYSGVIAGSGSLIKQGASIFTLAGANTYTGGTEVAAGTLRVGDGGTAGSLSTGAIQITGTLVLARSDEMTLAQAVSGSGSVEQAGSGRLVFGGGNKSHTGTTTVTRGELATAGSENLSDGSAVTVAAGAQLTLAGAETLRSLDADGTLALAGNLSAGGDLLMRGAVTVTGGGAVALAGQRIDAVSDGNRWGSSLALDAGDRITLSAGREGSALRDLTLGAVSAANGGRIDAGQMTLAALTRVSDGTLELAAAAPATMLTPDATLTGKSVVGLPMAFTADAVLQGATGRIDVAGGAGLSVLATGGGSVQLTRPDNNFAGGLSVVAGSATAPWSANSTSGTPAGGGAAVPHALQNRVRIGGTTVNIAGAGVIADVVHISADRLATAGPAGAGAAAIVARMPFDPTLGSALALPALTLELTPAAFGLSFPFGETGNGIRVDVGSQAWGNRTLALNAGYMTVLPRGGAQGSTAVLLSGPAVNALGYRFFFDGAGAQGEIPVFYNGVLPTTPAVENSISATVAVSEGARKERFEEAVRTENVAVRLRAGVIAEVGPAPAATIGTEGVRPPPTCAPAAKAPLGCAP